MGLRDVLLEMDLYFGRKLENAHDAIVRAEYLPIEKRLIKRDFEPTDDLISELRSEQQALGILAEGMPALVCAGKAFENYPQINPGYAVAFGVLTLDGISRFVRGHGLIQSLKEFGEEWLKHATYVDREHPEVHEYPKFPPYRDPF